MTDEEKKEKLLKYCPELSEGLTGDDLNRYILESIHAKILADKHRNVLVDRILELADLGEKLRAQLIRLEPLLSATEGEKV